MNKPLMTRLINEVGDLGDRMQLGLSYTAPGGSINPGVSTISSPTISQDSSKFVPSLAGSQSDINIKVPDDSQTSMEPTGSIEKAIDDIKYKVTPDDIIMGINAELRKMVFKRPDVAKQLVIQNLKNDPKYYKGLKFVGMDDDTIEESKKHMNDQEKAIFDIIREMKIKRNR